MIGDKEVEEISAYFQIAKMNRSLLTIEEALEATSIAGTPNEIVAAWKSNAALSSMYSLESGWVVERDLDPSVVSELTSAEALNRRRSIENIKTAGDFARMCVDRRVRLFAVSGGNSYGSAREWDDIDFFSITANDFVWIFMLKALIMARMRSLTRREAPLCFSYVVDERRGRSDFGRRRDGLFARDALMARVLSGREYYASMIARSSWMEEYFPSLYATRLSEANPGLVPESDGRGNFVLNSLLFYTLGTYVRVRAFLLNGRFRREGRSSAVFKAEIGKDRCIYESNRYRRLRRMYPDGEAGSSR